MHTVQELQENRSKSTTLTIESQTTTLTEFMTKREPLFFHQHSKAFKSPIEGIAE